MGRSDAMASALNLQNVVSRGRADGPMPRRNIDRRRGSLLVEAAIILPLLILVTFGVMEYGWMFVQYKHVTNAARHGARMAVKATIAKADEEQTAKNSVLATLTA